MATEQIYRAVFHVSESGNIEEFAPRPSPSRFEGLTGDVVFGIVGTLLHNYLLPRECPRVAYYAGASTSQADREAFFHSSAEFVLTVEAGWIPLLQQTTLYVYEFDSQPFSLLDDCAGYYVAYETVRPIRVTRIDNALDALLQRENVEVRIVHNLWPLVERVVQSSLAYSCIRLRNAQPRASNHAENRERH